MLALWPAVVQAVAASNTMVAAALAESRPCALADDELTVAFPAAQAFHKRLVERDVNRMQAAAALRSVTGRPLRLAFELRADLEPVTAADEVQDPEELIRRFVAEFDAQEILDEE